MSRHFPVVNTWISCFAITHATASCLSSLLGRGSGLGLVLAKEIISMHGGSVIVESEEGMGSAFGFRIPFELATSIPEIRHVETTEHTNVSHFNPCTFIFLLIHCSMNEKHLFFLHSDSSDHISLHSQSRLPFVRTRSSCESQETVVEGTYTGLGDAKDDDCTVLVNPCIFSAAPSAFSSYSRSNRSSMSVSTMASNPPSKSPSSTNSCDVSDSEADFSSANFAIHLFKTCLIVDGKSRNIRNISFHAMLCSLLHDILEPEQHV